MVFHYPDGSTKTRLMAIKTETDKEPPGSLDEEEKVKVERKKKAKPVLSAGGIYFLGRAGEFYAEEIAGNKFAIFSPDATAISIEDRFLAPTEEGSDDVLHLPANLKLWRLPTASLRTGVGFDEVFPQVRSFIKDHWDYPDEKAYDVFAAWLIASHVPELFPTVPFLFFFSGIEGVGYHSQRTRGNSTLLFNSSI